MGALHPFVVFKAKLNFKLEWALGGPSGRKYSISYSDWIELYILIKRFKEIFIPERQAIGDIHILHLDTTHVSLAVLFHKNSIIIIFQQAHSSHALQ